MAIFSGSEKAIPETLFFLFSLFCRRSGLAFVKLLHSQEHHSNAMQQHMELSS